MKTRLVAKMGKATNIDVAEQDEKQREEIAYHLDFEKRKESNPTHRRKDQVDQDNQIRH